MCLITVAYRVSERFPVVVAANRDERHARASAAAHWWPDAPGILGGRDLVARGTWLAVDRRARVGAVTNRAPPEPAPAALSRGALVVDYLSDVATAAEYAERAHAAGASYGPFNLVLIDAAGVHAVSNRGGRAAFTAGVRSFGNAAFDEDWPKLGAATAGVERALVAEDPVPALLDVLAMRHAPSPARGPDRDNVFVVGAEFGTRCSTVVLVGAAGRVVFAERRFDAHANAVGETRLEFDVDAGSRQDAAPTAAPS